MKARAETPWERGRLDGHHGSPTLLFGRMHEDCAIEASAFAPGGRVYCIASAGCTALVLAASGHEVTAVDINPAQVDYVRARLAGSPLRAGAVDVWMARGRKMLRLVGMGEPARRAFLMLDDPLEQARVWQRQFNGVAWRAGLGLALSPWVLRRAYSATFVRAVPTGFAAVIRRRLERGFATHPNRTNPYAWEMLLGCAPPNGRPLSPTGPVTLACADAAAYLEGAAAERFTGFSLSNVLDGASPAFAQRLLAAVRNAAAPGAVMVLRSLAEPVHDAAAEWARRDRSLLWGSVRVERLTTG